eukprot:8134956-Pyramimonas_sp.AAC.1
MVHHANIPTRPASEWSIMRIYPRVLRPIGRQVMTFHDADAELTDVEPSEGAASLVPSEGSASFAPFPSFKSTEGSGVPAADKPPPTAPQAQVQVTERTETERVAAAARSYVRRSVPEVGRWADFVRAERRIQ